MASRRTNRERVISVTNVDQSGLDPTATRERLGLSTLDSPEFVTVKLSGLTDGKIPYHVSDSDGLADGPLKTDVDDAVTKSHTAGTDTALAALGTKNPPIDADKVIYRDSVVADALVTSTWTQIKAFFKTYFDTLYMSPAASSELTIASGVVTVSGTIPYRRHTIDTESDAASDDLTTINGGNAYELLTLSAADDARTVVCKKGAGLLLQADFFFDSIDDILRLECKSAGVWREISRANNG